MNQVQRGTLASSPTIRAEGHISQCVAQILPASRLPRLWPCHNELWTCLKDSPCSAGTKQLVHLWKGIETLWVLWSSGSGNPTGLAWILDKWVVVVEIHYGRQITVVWTEEDLKPDKCQPLCSHSLWPGAVLHQVWFPEHRQPTNGLWPRVSAGMWSCARIRISYIAKLTILVKPRLSQWKEQCADLRCSVSFLFCY